MSKTFSDIFNIMSSNLLILITNAVNGLVLPYVLGVTEYGYYRIFILYSTYTALLHCGFVDGILLKYSGTDFSKLDKKKFRTFTKIFMLFQFIISLVMLLISLIITNKFYSLLLISLSLYTFIFNVMTYYMFIAQITMNFKLISIRNTCQSILLIILTLISCFVYKLDTYSGINYNTFIYILIFVYTVMLIWYLYTYRDITFGSSFSLRQGIKYLIDLCKLGIYLTISYQISSLILVIDNQFVSSLFNAQTYGRYSFSYSLSSKALVILSAVSTVLLPHLKRHSLKHITKLYPKIISYMMLAIYLTLLLYFPLCIIVKIIFPEYVHSLTYLQIFLSEMGMISCVTMIMFNYYNALNKSKFYFFMSIIILLISIIVNTIMYVLFHSPIGLAVGSFIDIFIWYIASEYFLAKWYHILWIRNDIYMILMITSFFISCVCDNLLIGFFIYLSLYVIFTFIILKKYIVPMITKSINIMRSFI